MSEALKHVSEIEEVLGLPPGFYIGLTDEDDWSFIIKLHAMIEAAITYLLVEASHNPELEDVFSRLELSNLKTGKLAFVRKQDLLEKEYISFIRTISEIRNEYVHKIGNVGSSLEDYLASLNKDKRDNFCKAVLMGIPDPMEIAGKRVPARVFILENPKIHIWMISMYLIGNIYLAQQRVEINRTYIDFAKGMEAAAGQ